MITKKTLYNQLKKLLQETKTMECIDYTWYTNSASIDLYDIISEEGEKEEEFFKEVDWLNNQLKKKYKTELKKFHYEYEMGAQARIYMYPLFQGDIMTNVVLKDEKTEKILLKVGENLIKSNIAFNCVSEYYDKQNKYKIYIYIKNKYIDTLQEIADIIKKKYDIEMDINQFSISKDLSIEKKLYDII